MSGTSKPQAKTAAIVKEMMEEKGVDTPLALSRADLADAHRAGYPQLADAPSKTVAAYTSANLKSPHFWAALGFDTNDMKQLLGDHIVVNLRGENPVFPKDKDLYLTSLKLGVGLAFETKSHVTIEGDFKKRSDEDLEFYIKNHRWPEDAPTIEG